jgi:hypothetical protein
MFEHHKEPLLSTKAFVKRLALSLLLGLSIIALSLIAGTVGYYYIEGYGWIEAFHEACMVFSGSGPVISTKSVAGQIFAGLFAIYSAFAVLLPISFVLAPVIHRLLHKFHLDCTDDG